VRARVSRWGNSLAIRIPSAFAEETQLDEGTAVEIAVEGGRLVVSAARPQYGLDELLDQVTDENIHGEIDWGPAAGNEVW
jgi:antitoxin MazE